MLKRINPIWLVIAAALVLRLVTMALVPFADTSEPRYAEMARVMAISGDWITPWFDVGKPFWGKPPLSFWSQALAIKWLGTSELAVRLPSWLATLATLFFIYRLARGLYGTSAARWAGLVYTTSALGYVAAGAVLTDPFLVLATTWIMAALLLNELEQRWYWRYGLFLGLTIGLLAKGPLVLVLVGGACFPAFVLFPAMRTRLLALPWTSGTLLTAVLVLPWYIAAEIKTPGFLHYFIVGEHLMRFIDPGWGGDLYGSAHQRVRGTIWLYGLAATFPWGLWALWMLVGKSLNSVTRAPLLQKLRDWQTVYLLSWMLFTPLFFTLAGNILWTYVLPSLPAFSILTARIVTTGSVPGIAADKPDDVPEKWVTLWGAALVPLFILIAGLVVYRNPVMLSTEKQMVHYLRQQSADAQLTFVGDPSFSARYYSRGETGSVALAEVPSLLEPRSQPLYLVVPNNQVKSFQALLEPTRKSDFKTRRFQLFVLPVTALAADETAPLLSAPLISTPLSPAALSPAPIAQETGAQSLHFLTPGEG